MRRHVSALIDKSAWILILPAIVVLAVIDLPLLKTLLSWTTFSVAIAGLSIIISRIVFPQVDLDKLLSRVEEGHAPSAIVATGLMIFVAMVFYSIIFWAKA